jgi:hypothetical protein
MVSSGIEPNGVASQKTPFFIAGNVYAKKFARYLICILCFQFDKSISDLPENLWHPKHIICADECQNMQRFRKARRKETRTDTET